MFSAVQVLINTPGTGHGLEKGRCFSPYRGAFLDPCTNNRVELGACRGPASGLRPCCLISQRDGMGSFVRTLGASKAPIEPAWALSSDSLINNPDNQVTGLRYSLPYGCSVVNYSTIGTVLYYCTNRLCLRCRGGRQHRLRNGRSQQTVNCPSTAALCVLLQHSM